jgi:hypothetical protein
MTIYKQYIILENAKEKRDLIYYINKITDNYILICSITENEIILRFNKLNINLIDIHIYFNDDKEYMYCSFNDLINKINNIYNYIKSNDLQNVIDYFYNLYLHNEQLELINIKRKIIMYSHLKLLQIKYKKYLINYLLEKYDINIFKEFEKIELNIQNINNIIYNMDIDIYMNYNFDDDDDNNKEEIKNTYDEIINKFKKNYQEKLKNHKNNKLLKKLEIQKKQEMQIEQELQKKELKKKQELKKRTNERAKSSSYYTFIYTLKF